MKIIIFPEGPYPSYAQLRYDVQSPVPTNPELWVPERIAANEEELKDIYERAVKQWQDIEFKCKMLANEHEMMKRLVEFGQWVVDNRDELSRMRMEEKEEMSNGDLLKM